jgi:hypothetical protein
MAEYQRARAGILPDVRRCADAVDLSFWFMCFAVALRARRTVTIINTAAIERVRTTVRVCVESPEDVVARKGRTLQHVRR